MREKTILGIITVIFLIVIICLSIEMGYFIPEEVTESAKIRQIYCNIEKEHDFLDDAFFLIWTTTIAVAIFIIETSNEYRYGITLKRIIEITMGLPLVFGCAVLYILLCPVYIWAEMSGSYIFILILFAIAFGGLVCLLVFWFSMTRSSRIRILLKQETIRLLKEKALRGKYPVDEVIMHTDYNIEEETENLCTVLADISEECEEDKVFVRGGGRHTWLMERIYQLISHFDITDEYHRLQLGDFLWKLRKSLIKDGKDKKKNILYTVQIFIPLIDFENKTFNEVFFWLWRRIGEDSEIILPYLLCYAEYIFMTRHTRESLWLYQKDICIERDVRKMLSGKIFWNVHLALEMWIDWERLRKYNDNYGLKNFFTFATDIENIKDGKIQEVKTYTIKLIQGRDR